MHNNGRHYGQHARYMLPVSVQTHAHSAARMRGETGTCHASLNVRLFVYDDRTDGRCDREPGWVVSTRIMRDIGSS